MDSVYRLKLRQPPDVSREAVILYSSRRARGEGHKTHGLGSLASLGLPDHAS